MLVSTCIRLLSTFVFLLCLSVISHMHLAVHSQSGRSALVVSCCLLGPSSGSCFAFGRRWLARCCFFFFFFLIDAGRWCVAPLAHIPVSSDAIDAGRWCVAPLAHILVSSATLEPCSRMPKVFALCLLRHAYASFFLFFPFILLCSSSSSHTCTRLPAT